MYIYFLFLIPFVHSFKLYMKSPKTNEWKNLQNSMKETARNWFVNRAIKRGIPWNELYEKNNKNQEAFEIIKKEKEDESIEYPEYYTKPFHGYDDGNMNWKAAMEAEAATLSIAAGYWDKVDPYEASVWMRQNITENIKSYFQNTYDWAFQIERGFPRNVLDIGCSTGISTCYLKENMPHYTSTYGIDLSPYFLSVGTHFSNENNLSIHYVHGNAENTTFSSGMFDLIVCNFIFHELPENAACNVINEMFRLLSEKGIVAIVDIDPNNLDKQLKNNIFRKWAFEITEPHIYNYYKRDMVTMLKDGGFINVEKRNNDPLNSVWLGTKEPLFAQYLQTAQSQKIQKKDVNEKKTTKKFIRETVTMKHN